MVDKQGRCVITDHGAFVLFNCYGPAVTNIINDRFALKMQYYEVRPCTSPLYTTLPAESLGSNFIGNVLTLLVASELCWSAIV